MYNNSHIKTLVIIKLHQLQREELSTLTYQNLLDYLFMKKWKDFLPETLNDIASDVMNIKAQDVVSFLSFQAIVEGKNNDLDDYSDLIK